MFKAYIKINDNLIPSNFSEKKKKKKKKHSLVQFAKLCALKKLLLILHQQNTPHLVRLKAVHQFNKDLVIYESSLGVAVDLAVIITNELLNKFSIVIQDLITHVRNVVEHSLIFDLQRK